MEPKFNFNSKNGGLNMKKECKLIKMEIYI